jgi:branched-chain amino acid transport system substrate-binding protein
MVLSAAGRHGSFDPETLRAELARAPFEAPQGRIELDPDNGHFYLWPRIGRLGSDGQFAIVEQSRRPVKPDPYLINHSLADWDPVPDPAFRVAEG